MKTAEMYGSVEFSTAASLKPDDPEEFLLEIAGQIKGLDDEDSELVVGKLTAHLAMTNAAADEGVALAHVCDARSQALHEAYAAIFDAQGEPRPELDIEACWQGFLYIESLDIKAEYRGTDAATGAIRAVIQSFCPVGIIAAERDLLPLAEWRSLGFKIVPGSEVVFRDMWTPEKQKRRRSSPAEELKQHIVAVCDGLGLRADYAKVQRNPRTQNRLVQVGAAIPDWPHDIPTINISAVVASSGEWPENVNLRCGASEDPPRLDGPWMHGRNQVPLHSLADAIRESLNEREQVVAAVKLDVPGPYRFESTVWYWFDQLEPGKPV